MSVDLNSWALENQTHIRLGFFFGVFTLMALWEIMAPRRSLQVSKPVRWTNNLVLVFMNTLLLRIVFPATAVGMALMAQEQGWGVINYYGWNGWGVVAISVVILDFFIYLQHVMVHAVPLLWRLHRVHHADLDYDVTTGARFHPIEILLSMLIKLSVILLLGAPALAVLMFEVILNATAMFNHGNVRLPESLDRLLRWVVVTPDMHRVHHSVEDDEANSNFGFNLPWWDRVFGTYRDQPRGGQEGMTIGIRSYRDTRWCSWLPGLLTLPFIGKISAYAINRRTWEDPDGGGREPDQ